MMVNRRESCALSSSTPSSTGSDAMAVRTIEQQLLTPATSQSEASSNIDVALDVDKEENRHPTRRVTRSSLSLGSMEVSNATEGRARRHSRRSVSDLKAQAVSEKALVGVSERGTSRPAPSGQSLSMESDCKALVGQDRSRQSSARNTSDPKPIAKRPVELGISPGQQTPRKRGDGVRSTREKDEQELEGKVGLDNKKAERRSSRLALKKAVVIPDKASTVLGKRMREVTRQEKPKVKEMDRRASLRPRNVLRKVQASSAPPPPPPHPGSNGTARKKRRVSDNALSSKKTIEEIQPTVQKPLLVHKPKPWLSHGLYAGQERYYDPRLTDAKNRVKHAEKNAKERGKLLPLPMFAGERLMETGRDFKLPFDIFSPLPPGQPKPDEWRKTNKSE